MAMFGMPTMVGIVIARALATDQDLSRVSLPEALLAAAGGVSFMLVFYAVQFWYLDWKAGRGRSILSEHWWGLLLLWFASGVALQLAAEFGR